jgi:hypothetical protein
LHVGDDTAHSMSAVQSLFALHAAATCCAHPAPASGINAEFMHVLHGSPAGGADGVDAQIEFAHSEPHTPD